MSSNPNPAPEPPAPVAAASPSVAPAPPAPPTPPHKEPPAAPKAAPPPPATGKFKWQWILVPVILVVAYIYGKPWVVKAMNTVFTDDAFVNGHVTFVAPRVSGQVVRVLVDDNNRVHKGDLLLQLDREPFQAQVDIAQAAVASAQADLDMAMAQARSSTGQMRSLRFNLERAIQDVDNQVALLRAKVAGLESQKASLVKAQTDYVRAESLLKPGAVSQELVDDRKQALAIAQSQVEVALQGVYQIRVSLGLPPRPEKGDDLTQVPDDLGQTYSSVRQAQASLIQAAAQLGIIQTFTKTPREMVAEFYKRDPLGDIDRIYADIIKNAPSIKQAESKLIQAQRKLDDAKLNLKYCDVFAEIDGVVTRRSVNPGNNLVAGQSLMALRSLTEIWVDANFKETQLSDLRIGLPVELEVDMYGGKQSFKGRISGFTMGTGSTLALLPPENATGNYVKVVQRLPVRIDLVGYDPDKTPLFIGVSVEPTVLIREPATGPNAGQLLQPYSAPAASLSESPAPATPSAVNVIPPAASTAPAPSPSSTHAPAPGPAATAEKPVSSP